MSTRIPVLLLSLSLCAGLLTGCNFENAKLYFGHSTPSGSYSEASSASASGSDASEDGSASDSSAEGASSQAAASSSLSGRLTDYLVDGIGVFSLPEGFEVTTGTQEELSIPYVSFTREGILIQVNRFGPEVFEAANTPMPDTVEEYSQYSGAQADLPEGSSYEEDPYGNWSATWSEAGSVHILILMKGANSFASAYVTYPEGVEGLDDIPLWLSLSALD